MRIWQESEYVPDAYGSPVANEGGLGFKFFNERIQKAGKAKTISTGEQFKRVTVASAFFRPSDLGLETPLSFRKGGIYPLGRRTKDITSYFIFGKGEAEQLKASSNPIKRLRGKALEESQMKVWETFSKEQKTELS